MDRLALKPRPRPALRIFSASDPRRIEARADFAAEHKAMGEPLFGPGRPEGPCWTLGADAGRWSRPLACGGFDPQGHGRFVAWLYAGDLSPRGWASVARAFRRMVAETGARRVEATVRADGVAGAGRFAEALGLKPEGLMKSFGPDGADYWLFAGVF